MIVKKPNAIIPKVSFIATAQMSAKTGKPTIKADHLRQVCGDVAVVLSPDAA